MNNKFIVIRVDFAHDVFSYGEWNTFEEAYAFAKKEAERIQAKTENHDHHKITEYQDNIELEDWGIWYVSKPTKIN